MIRSLASAITFPPQPPRTTERADERCDVTPPLRDRCVVCTAPIAAHYDAGRRFRGCRFAVRHAGRMD